MPDYILLMHDDCTREEATGDWNSYLEGLSKVGVLRGGSAIGAGVCFRKQEPPGPLTSAVNGFVRITARDLDEARELLAGNPVYEAGGTVEIRLLPETD